jgi:ribosomal protein S18 acetylase RimI-like enzyme
MIKKYKIQLRKLIYETIEYVGYDSDGWNEELDDIGIEDYEAANEAERIAKSGGIQILSDKRLVGLLITGSNVVGGLWISDDSHSFSFDIAVKKEYQRMGLSYKLIDMALEEYNIQNEVYYDMEGSELPMAIDVVNPILAKTLINKYNFKIKDKVGPDRVILTK